MRTVVAAVLGAVAASALLLSRQSPAAPAADKWEYKVLDVEAGVRTPMYVRVDRETKEDAAKRVASDPLLQPFAATDSDGWELVSVASDPNTPTNYIYFFRRQKP